MEATVAWAALAFAVLSTAVSATWIMAQLNCLKRKDLDAVVSNLTTRIDALLDKLNIIATNSVTRAEFAEELHILRTKVTNHIGDHNIHVSTNH